MNVVIIGGDARQLEVIDTLSERGVQLSLIGFDQIEEPFAGVENHTFSSIHPADVDAVILPVSGIAADGKVESRFSSEYVYFDEHWFMNTKPSCTLYSGIKTNQIEKLIQKSEKRFVELLGRDDVAIYNSVPTAEGTVMTAIQHTDKTIHNSHVCIFGLGRVGTTVTRLFQGMGAKVTVVAQESERLARGYEMGANIVPLSSLQEENLEDIDIVINTIPSPVVTAETISKLSSHALIIDLAANPGGTDFDYAKKAGIKAKFVPGLPGIVAPKTAGKIIATTLAKLLREQHE